MCVCVCVPYWRVASRVSRRLLELGRELLDTAERQESRRARAPQTGLASEIPSAVLCGAKLRPDKHSLWQAGERVWVEICTRGNKLVINSELSQQANKLWRRRRCGQRRPFYILPSAPFARFEPPPPLRNFRLAALAAQVWRKAAAEAVSVSRKGDICVQTGALPPRAGPSDQMMSTGMASSDRNRI